MDRTPDSLQLHVSIDKAEDMSRLDVSGGSYIQRKPKDLDMGAFKITKNVQFYREFASLLMWGTAQPSVAARDSCEEWSR